MTFLRIIVSTLLTIALTISNLYAQTVHEGNEILKSENEELITTLYKSAKLKDAGLSYYAYERAMIGYLNLINKKELNNTRVLSILDFTQPSTAKRFYIIDLKTGQLLLKTYVSHGRNSGLLYAENFSNVVNSKKSSHGMYKAAETYKGKYGLSLKLDGLEEGINNNARNRAIVLHPAKYVSEKFKKQNGYMGRSFGCPAVSYSVHKKVINYIKGGSAFYIYTYDDKKDLSDLFVLPENTWILLSKYTNIPARKIKIKQSIDFYNSVDFDKELAL